MSLFKILSTVVLLLACTVGLAALIKSHTSYSKNQATLQSQPVKIQINTQNRPLKPAPVISSVTPSLINTPTKEIEPIKIESPLPAQNLPSIASDSPPIPDQNDIAIAEELPEADRMAELFSTDGPTLPIVETITYKSRVDWQKGRPAWLSDYARHYQTSIHFIARSINREPNYLKQEISEGGKLNILKKDKNFRFHLIVDTSRCKLWLYYIDLETHQKVLLKTYPVCLGRIDSSKASGLLTPLGIYSLGNKTAIYDSKIKGNYRGENIVMKTVYGTRWIPFDREIKSCSLPAKGFGLHGVPWHQKNGSSGPLVEYTDCLGKYESDGCIRLASQDVEELYAVITTKPTQIEIVRHFNESSMVKEN